MQLAQLVQESGCSGVALQGVGDDCIAKLAGEDTGPEAHRRAGIRPPVQRQPRCDIVEVTATGTLGGEAVIIPAHAQRGGEARADLPFVFQIEGQQGLIGAEGLRSQFNGIIGHHRVQRQHVRGGQSQPAAACAQRS